MTGLEREMDATVMCVSNERDACVISLVSRSLPDCHVASLIAKSKRRRPSEWRCLIPSQSSRQPRQCSSATWAALTRKRAVIRTLPSASLQIVVILGCVHRRLQLYSIPLEATFIEGKGARAPGECIKEQQYLNVDFASFDDIVAAFMKNFNGTPPVSACFAVAGPVENNRE